MRMWTRRVGAPSSSGSTQESPCSTHCYSDRHCCPLSWAEWSKSGNGEDEYGSLGRLSTSQDSGNEEENEAGHPPAPTSSLLSEQQSSSKSPEAVPEETMPTVDKLPPTSSQDAIIIHTMEDELRSLD